MKIAVVELDAGRSSVMAINRTDDSIATCRVTNAITYDRVRMHASGHAHKSGHDINAGGHATQEASASGNSWEEILGIGSEVCPQLAYQHTGREPEPF